MTEEAKKTAIFVSSRRRLPKFCLAVYAIALLCTGLYFAFTRLPHFADVFNRYVSAPIRALLGLVTAWIPFSLAEILLLLLPVWIVLLIVLAAKRYCGSWHDALVYLGILLSIAAIVWNLFVLTFAAGYYGSRLEDRLGLSREKVSAEELYATAEHLADELRRLTPAVSFSEDGSSVMPYSYAEMNRKLMSAYEKFTSDKDFIHHTYSRVKPVLLSEPMTYTHITGVYTFFTGEANINVHFPDYTIPYTAAHELAHQRGIAREDEANFVAYLVCMESEDPYLRYSATLSLYEYVISALSKADRTLYKQSYTALPAEIRAEEAAFSAFFDKYRENTVANVSQTVNNSYLQSQGAPEGTRSYNLVVDLAVAYYKAQPR